MEGNVLNQPAAQTAAPFVINSQKKPDPFIKANLRRLLSEPPETDLYYNKLYKHVIGWILKQISREYGVKAVMDDLLKAGCASGMVGHLIYYWDSKRFYIQYMDEIHELMDNLEDSLGEPLKAEGKRAHWYACFGFEEMARKIYDFFEQQEEGLEE